MPEDSRIQPVNVNYIKDMEVKSDYTHQPSERIEAGEKIVKNK